MAENDDAAATTDMLNEGTPPSQMSEDGGSISHTYENSLQRKNYSISPNGRKERFDFWEAEPPVQAGNQTTSRTPPEISEYANTEDICSNERVYANTLPRTAPDLTGNQTCYTE